MKIPKATITTSTQYRVPYWGGPYHRSFYNNHYLPQSTTAYFYKNLAASPKITEPTQPNSVSLIQAKMGTYKLYKRPSLHYRWKGWNK